MTARIQRIGLISDTHGLLRPQALEALHGSELILHAGDVGKPEILDELRNVAPVIAVRGNVDTETWCSVLKETEIVKTGAATIYMLHNLNALNLDPAARDFQIVISGHTHKHTKFEKDGVLYLNPGSAGPRRFNLPITVARLDLTIGPWNVQFIQLPSTG